MKRILIVGDELGTLIEMMFKRDGKDDVTLVPTVEMALERCETDPPDLVVMSWTSVGVTWGDEFTARLRALPTGQAIPLILVSAYHHPQYIARILECGGPTEIAAAPFLHPDILEMRNRLLGEE